MNTRQLTKINILLWGGAGLLILGIMLSFSTFAPYLETLVYTNKIPTAPALTVGVTTNQDAPSLLPFEGEERVTTKETPPPASPTIADPATTTPMDQESVSQTEPEATSDPFTPTPEASKGTAPLSVRIPAIDLDAPIEAIGWTTTEVNGVTQAMWDVPDWRAAGWHKTSAPLGVVGNTVLNGHNTSNGEVFRYLYKVEIGSLILVEGEDGETYSYQVGEKYILAEAGQPLEVRVQNAAYIQPTTDERLTLVTCHPYGSLANRLLLIAYPQPQPEIPSFIEGE